MSKSALRLRGGNSPILDVALDMGFGSVDGYQRAFAREFGCNPKEYAGGAFCRRRLWSSYRRIWEAEKKYNPSAIVYMWDLDNPRVQLEPIGTRGLHRASCN